MPRAEATVRKHGDLPVTRGRSDHHPIIDPHPHGLLGPLLSDPGQAKVVTAAGQRRHHGHRHTGTRKQVHAASQRGVGVHGEVAADR